MTPDAQTEQAEAVVANCTHPGWKKGVFPNKGACVACLTTALQDQAKRDATLCRKIRVAHQRAKSYPMDSGGLAKECARAIEAEAGLG